MKALVIGASGGVGLATMRALLAGGHEATAFVRDASRLPDGLLDALPDSGGAAVVQGDVMDAAAVTAAVPGHDVVMVALGAPRGRPTADDVCAVGTGHVVAAMQAAGVRRLLVVTTLGLGDTKAKTPLLFRLVMATILKKQIADKVRQEAVVMASGLDWTLVRPVGLSSKPATGAWLADANRVRNMQVSRADVAMAMVSMAESGAYVGAGVIISG